MAHSPLISSDLTPPPQDVIARHPDRAEIVHLSDRGVRVTLKARSRDTFKLLGIMLGLGEEREELVRVMADLVEIKVDILTLGQYLQPTPHHLPVYRFVHPDEFAELREIGLEMGFRNVESGPLVRSSYHAEQHI